jgi:acetolactate synthase-1/2/3 large subunit
VAKWSGVLGSAQPLALVAACVALAVTPPAGAVHLAFDPTTPGDEPPPLPSRATGAGERLEAAAELVAAARRPVVIVGLDAVADSEAVRAALRGVNCPVLVTYEAKGVVPESWSSYAGLFTGAAIERPLLEQADLIIGLGLDPVEPMPGAWPYGAPVVLLHRHGVGTDYFGRPLLVVGASPAERQALLSAVISDWPAGFGADVRERDAARLRVPTSGLDPVDVVLDTQRAVGDVLATVDAGAHMLVAMPFWHTDEAQSVLISNGLATMGFALPAAVGMALARPGRRVVCFVGDGGLSMVQGELETLARLALDVTVVVFNDATLTLIKLKQGEGQAGPAAVGYGAIDFAAIAAAMGVRSAVAHDREGLQAALAAPAPGPMLIDAQIDPSAYPHVIKITRG